VLRLVADPPVAASRTAFQTRPAWSGIWRSGLASGRRAAGPGGPVVAITAEKGNDALAVRRLAGLYSPPEPDYQGRDRP